MAVSQLYTAVTGDIITAARWNNEYGNIYNNGTAIAFPLTSAVSFAGVVLTIDATGATTLNSTGAIAYNLTLGAKTGTPGVTTGASLALLAHTFTDTATAVSGTATSMGFTTIARPTLAATNLTVTTTDAATVYIANSPANGTNETITNPWAVWVDDGNVRLDGILQMNASKIRFNFITGDNISLNTSDAADNGLLEVSGGGVSGATRGAFAQLYGNEHASTGKLNLNAGNVAGGTVDIYTAATLIASFLRDGGLTLSTAAPATPIAKTIYEDTIIKGWAKWSTSGGAVTLDDDVNVSSITDNTVGDFTVNWATAFSSAHYAIFGSVMGTSVDNNTPHFLSLKNTVAANPTTTAVRVLTVNDAGTLVDPVYASLSAVGNN